jgi:hypothetical protein
MGNIIKKGGQSVSEILKGMVKPTETINRITVKTTVQTDEAIHNVWQTTNKYGNTAIFNNTKNKK